MVNMVISTNYVISRREGRGSAKDYIGEGGREGVSKSLHTVPFKLNNPPDEFLSR